MNGCAIVTGASSGIGEATVWSLAEQGFDVVPAARREDRITSLAEQVAATFDISATPVVTDVREEREVTELVETAASEHDRLDVLVNNAGIGRGGEITEMSTEDYRSMMQTNVDGVFFATRAALPHLVESQGQLICVGSFAGCYPRSFNPIYAASKWWVRGFAHSVGAQVGKRGVGVTVINPSEVRTEFDLGDYSGADGDTFEDAFEPGEVTEPEEVAEAIAFAATVDRATVSELDLYRRDKFSDTF